MPEKNIVVTSGIPMTPPSSGGGAGGYGVSISAPSLPSGSDLAYRQGYNAAHKYQRAVRQKVESDYATSTSRLPQKITEEVAKMRSELLTSKSSTTEGLKLVKATIEKLISQASQQRDAQVAISLAYDGADPTPYPIRDKPGYDTGDPEGRFGYYAMVRQWAKAYEAAYQAKLLGDMVSLLSGQLTNVNTELTAAAVAKAAADKAAAAAAAKVAADKAAAAQAEEIRANTFRAQGSVAAAQPLFVVSSGVIAVAEATATLLAAAIRAAIVGLTSAVVGSASAVAVGVFSLLAFPSKMGNSEMPERYSFSTPLSDLAPNLGLQKLQAAATVGGTVDMPVRISSKTAEDGRSEVFVVKTDGVTIPSKVKVIAATYNAGQNVYTATTADVPPRTLTWTPIVSPGNSSTTSPAQQPLPPAYTGATVTPVQGRIDTFPAVAEASFDDYIMILPVGTGFVPVYMMFRDRREDPGVATGVGQPVSGIWLGAASQGEGAPIPSQIADQLRGREFKSWRAFREAFWKAVANDPELSKQFDPSILETMKKGRAPIARDGEQVGKRVKIELHHKVYIALGGKIYDFDNLSAMTPKRHVDTHKGTK